MSILTSAKFEEPAASGLARSVVEEVAAKIARKVGYVPGAELEPVVAGLGGRIEYEDWNFDAEHGSLEVYPGEKRFVIRIPSFVGNLRNRFTIAHELGHYFLHSDVGKRAIKVARAGTGRVEWEANWFAASFLMPEKEFREDWDLCGGRLARLAGIYAVSEGALEIRAERLGLRAAAP